MMMVTIKMESRIQDHQDLACSALTRDSIAKVREAILVKIAISEIDPQQDKTISVAQAITFTSRGTEVAHQIKISTVK
jgi:hypothetical protein